MDFTQLELENYIEEHGIVPIFTEEEVVEIIKDDLTGGQIVNLELDDTTIRRNIKRAITYMSMYYTGLSYVTRSPNSTTKSGGFIDLEEIDKGGGECCIRCISKERYITNRCWTFRFRSYIPKYRSSIRQSNVCLF